MDRSICRVLEALLPGPATPRILVQTYRMGVEESEQALAAAIDGGLVEEVGPVGFGLTEDGRLAAGELVGAGRRDRARGIAGVLGDRAARIH